MLPNKNRAVNATLTETNQKPRCQRPPLPAKRDRAHLRGRIWMGRGRQRGTGGRLQVDRDTNCSAAGVFIWGCPSSSWEHNTTSAGPASHTSTGHAQPGWQQVNNSSSGQFHQNDLPTSTSSPSSDRCLSIAAEPSKTRKNSFSGSPRTSFLPVFRLDQFHGISYPEMFPLVQRC